MFLSFQPSVSSDNRHVYIVHKLCTFMGVTRKVSLIGIKATFKRKLKGVYIMRKRFVFGSLIMKTFIRVAVNIFT